MAKKVNDKNEDLNQAGKPGEGENNETGANDTNEQGSEETNEAGEGSEDKKAGQGELTEQTGDEAKEAKPAKPVAKKSVAVDPVFKNNPKLDVYYRTADGTAFYTENAARNYAVKLKEKEIKKITRG